MTQNPEMFPEPDVFRPERYLDDPSLPYNFLFGFGRRLCPGMHVAQNSLFMVISKLLWSFDVLPPVDSKTGTSANTCIKQIQWRGLTTFIP